MRYLTLLLSILLISSCKDLTTDADAIVQKAYKAHGGKAVWDAISQLTYEKESVVYNADGSTRINTLQQHHYMMNPEFSAVITWAFDGEAHRIESDGNGARKWVNGVEQVDPATQASAFESVNAARYTVSQPFKLTDPGVMLSYEGIDTLEDGEVVHVIKAGYNTENENHTKNDEWWYYFDVDTYLCLATMVHHGSTFSYLRNLEFDRSTAIVFNKHRKGYAVDSTRKFLYHQSEYFYRNFRLSFSTD
jgi:hypothetical protein